jgi:hypothetical protein
MHLRIVAKFLTMKRLNTRARGIRPRFSRAEARGTTGLFSFRGDPFLEAIDLWEKRLFALFHIAALSLAMVSVLVQAAKHIELLPHTGDEIYQQGGCKRPYVKPSAPPLTGGQAQPSINMDIPGTCTQRLGMPQR